MQAILLGALVYLQCQQVFISQRILQSSANVLPEGLDVSRSQTWRYLDSEGVLKVHTTTTIRHAGESKVDFLARFEAEVAADEALYPPTVS
jgi:hypothetical protein